MYRKELQIVKLSNNIPDIKRETTKSAGLDLYANLETSVILNPFERRLIGAGIKAIAPSGFHIEIRPRSGLAAKHGITVLNSPGTIDEDYKEEIKVILINLSMDPYTINPLDRIAQMVITPVSYIEPTFVDNNTFEKNFITNEMNSRNGGFGSTGK